MSEKNSFSVFSGTNTRYLAEKICASLGVPLGKLQITRFSDGEFPMKNLSEAVMYFLYKVHSPIQITSWNCS